MKITGYDIIFKSGNDWKGGIYMKERLTQMTRNSG